MSTSCCSVTSSVALSTPRGALSGTRTRTHPALHVPCGVIWHGGTHVRRTDEVPHLHVAKTESKGKAIKRIRLEVRD